MAIENTEQQIYTLVQSSIDRIQDKLDNKFDNLSSKIDSMNEKIGFQAETLETRINARIDKEVAEISLTNTKFSNRLGKTESWQTAIKAVVSFLVVALPLAIGLIVKFTK